MSYLRFKRLRKFINGIATDEYMKSSERYDLIAYDSYFSCTQGYAQITRWIDTPVTECHNGNLCSMKKQQVSFDNGNSWQDTGIIQVKDIVEYNARECLAYLEEWRVVQGEYTCENFNKYAIEAEYVSYDSGETWEATGQTRIGQMIEPLSSYCGVLYQWVTVPNEFICVGTDKYTLQKEQYSIDEGETWIDTGNERPGTLIETESEDCGYEPSYIYQWVVVSGEYVCVGTDKFQKEKEQRSADGGQTWEDTGNTRAGSLIERQSYDCGYISYRWITDPTTYECVNFDKYSVEKEQQTTDGQTWTDTGRTRTGSLIEHDSTDCGYIPPLPTNIKARLTYLNGDTYDVPFNGDSTLTKSNVGRGISSSSDPHHKSKIVSAVITENVTSIGSQAFNICYALSSVTIPNTVTLIDTMAFQGCSSLTSVTIPNLVTTIGRMAFNDCSALTSITIPDSVTSMGTYVFSGCSALTSATIPDNITSIGEATFLRCSSLTSVNIPDSATSIGQGAFNECSSLTSITIPDGVTSIGSSAFRMCSSLTSVNIPDGVTSIGQSAFNSCGSLVSINIPDGITSIESNVFYGCSGLTTVTIGNGVTSIDDSAFTGCRSLTSVTIPNGVTWIGNYAFNNCASLTSITIPSSVTSIGNTAFNSCSSLTSVTCLPTTPPTLGTNVFGGTNDCPIYVPTASVQTYKTTTRWSTYASRIQAIS